MNRILIWRHLLPAFSVATLLLNASLASAQSLYEKASKDELAYMGDQEPAMKKAMQRARAELDQFLAIAKAPPPNTESFSLKVAIAEGRDVEYFWVGDFVWKGEDFEGTINNEPRLVKSVKFQQRYKFSRAKIVDWTYIDKGRHKMMGNYTLCALLTKEPPGEAAAMKKRFGLDCES